MWLYGDMTTTEQVLTQVAEFGYFKGDAFYVDHEASYEVSAGNKERIIAREKSRGYWSDGWFWFPTHPAMPSASECFTRIKWEDN